MSYVPPIKDSHRFTCPTCNALASQKWKSLLYPTGLWENMTNYLAVIDIDPEDEEYADPQQGEQDIWSASHCAACGNHALWIGENLVYPLSASDGEGIPQPNPDMPEPVKDLYREAAAVLPHSRRAAAALCRAALEMLAKHLTPELDSKLKLDGRLVALTRGESTGLDKSLQVIRHVGNKALHGADAADDLVTTFLQDSSTPQIAGLFFVALNDLVHEHITRPRIQQEAYDALPEGVRVNFESKVEASAPKETPL